MYQGLSSPRTRAWECILCTRVSLPHTHVPGNVYCVPGSLFPTHTCLGMYTVYQGLSSPHTRAWECILCTRVSLPHAHVPGNVYCVPGSLFPTHTCLGTRLTILSNSSMTTNCFYCNSQWGIACSLMENEKWEMYVSKTADIQALWHTDR